MITLGRWYIIKSEFHFVFQIKAKKAKSYVSSNKKYLSRWCEKKTLTNKNKDKIKCSAVQKLYSNQTQILIYMYTSVLVVWDYLHFQTALVSVEFSTFRVKMGKSFAAFTVSQGCCHLVTLLQFLKTLTEHSRTLTRLESQLHNSQICNKGI